MSNQEVRDGDDWYRVRIVPCNMRRIRWRVAIDKGQQTQRWSFDIIWQRWGYTGRKFKTEAAAEAAGQAWLDDLRRQVADRFRGRVL